MREEFKQDLSRLSQSAQHINRYSWSLHNQTKSLW